MKSRMVNWIKEHRKTKVIALGAVVALLLVALVVPISADWSLDYLDVTGTYLVTTAASPRELDNDRHPKVKFNELTITTQTGKAITVATLEHLGTNIDLDGLVGPGTRPSIYLYGTDSDGTYVHIQGRVNTDRDDAVTGINGRITGMVTSAGSRYEASADGTTAVSVAEYHSQPLSCLIVGGTDANPKTILFHNPVNKIRVRNLTTLKAGQLGFWFNLETATTPGPEMMLRFAPEDRTDGTNQTYWGGAGTAYVDITVMPYQAPYVGTGAWVECDLADDAATIIYYGNDPTDYTSFGGTPVSGLENVAAAIDAEAAMTAGGDTCANWLLTMVSVELWEAGDRDCYVDDVTIGGQLYTLEPNSYVAGFKAVIEE